MTTRAIRTQNGIAAYNALPNDASTEDRIGAAMDAARCEAFKEALMAVHDTIYPKNPRSDWTEEAVYSALLYELAEQAIRALSSAPPPATAQPLLRWKLIESAPKDREIIIRGGTVMEEGHTFDDWFEFTRMSLAQWHGYGSDAGWRGEHGETYDNWYWHRPTHWIEKEVLLALPLEAHDSDCAMHNEPAERNGPCDCSLSQNAATAQPRSEEGGDQEFPLANRREVLALSQPKCPNCKTDQIQLTHAQLIPAHWKCRMCREVFEFEPRPKDLTTPSPKPEDALREALEPLEWVVEYRGKFRDSGERAGPHDWRVMAAYDGELVAERYAKKCNEDSDIWEYRHRTRAALAKEGE